MREFFVIPYDLTSRPDCQRLSSEAADNGDNWMIFDPDLLENVI